MKLRTNYEDTSVPEGGMSVRYHKNCRHCNEREYSATAYLLPEGWVGITHKESKIISKTYEFCGWTCAMYCLADQI